MANSNLTSAKNAKNDEFYTQWADIEKEVNAYLDFNPDVFRDKVVLCPCDDPEWSNFTKFFALHFHDFGLKKLISTSFAADSNKFNTNYQPSLFETESPKYDVKKTSKYGKIFVLERTTDNKHKPKINIDDLEWDYLPNDGDFRSSEVSKLREEVDIIITNPPFSLFREFIKWIMDAQKQFLVIGNMNAITYKEIFPLIKDNKMWLGNGFNAGNAYFATPFASDYGDGVYYAETGLVKFRNVCWFTNLDHGRRHQPLVLRTAADNLRFCKHAELKGKTFYDSYDNYDAIEVPFADAIPSDYNGAMGVPISFLDKYCPEQFEILGMCENIDLYNMKTKVYTSDECKKAYLDKFGKKGTYDLNASGVIVQNGLLDKVYQRILIKAKQGAVQLTQH
ncbi:putative adenine-specific methylase [Spirochaetia bacterium]|nr:putative adenine-specific methylase [Spirochaetia bacterium]